MKNIITSLFLLVAIAGKGQDKWHDINVLLKPPENKYGIHPSIGSYQGYDTVYCDYKIYDTSGIRHGYKLVYVKWGFYSDDSKTIGVIYDSAFHRIHNAYKYRFHE